jgi:hypothetical protein
LLPQDATEVAPGLLAAHQSTWSSPVPLPDMGSLLGVRTGATRTPGGIDRREDPRSTRAGRCRMMGQVARGN